MLQRYRATGCKNEKKTTSWKNSVNRPLKNDHYTLLGFKKFYELVIRFEELVIKDTGKFHLFCSNGASKFCVS